MTVPRVEPRSADPVVGVVGAGPIGASVAHAVRVALGTMVYLVDADGAALERARHDIRRLDRLGRLTRSAPGDDGGSICLSSSLASLSAVDVVVENITESESQKRSLYAELDTILRPDTVIAANTSAIPIGSLAGVLDDPGRVVGVHFMNPVVQIPVVELIPSAATSPRAEAVITDLLTRMGKRTVAVRDSAGFVINRILMGVVNMAAELVDDGVASPAAVDRLFVGCLGHRTGPLRTADLIGLDTVVRTLDVLLEHHGAEVYRPHPLLLRKVESGDVGVKAGAGFFSYTVRRDDD
jgi:3-hydroxyacyl-CoA dehydrogenase